MTNPTRTSGEGKETVKVVINGCWGGFGLSPKGTEAYLARKGKETYWFTDARDDDGRMTLGIGQRLVPIPTPADGFIPMAYSYTSPEPTDEAYFYHGDIERDDPNLVAVVEELGAEAFGPHAALRVVEIPAGVEWVIEEYDGLEHVAEQHRVWS